MATNSTRRVYAIADMAKQGKQVIYTLVTLLLEYDPEATPTAYKWKFVNATHCKPEQVYQKISADNRQVGNRSLKLVNFKFDENKLVVGDPASLSRFLVDAKDNDPKFKPWVALSKITNNGKILGYVMLARDHANGRITLAKRRVEDMSVFGRKFTDNDLVPVQNLRYMNDSNSFSVYPHSEIFEEPMNTNKIRRTKSMTNATPEETAKENKALDLSKVYTPEQIKQLKLGKQHNVKISVYKDPKLSAEQMEALRKGLEKRIDVRALANPKIDIDVIKYCIEDMKNGLDITRLSEVYKRIPEFSVEQIAHISLAYDMGIDVSKIADPSLTPSEMSSRIVAMQNSIWQDDGVDIIIDGVPFVAEAAEG